MAALIPDDEECRVIFHTEMFHPGPVAPPAADGARFELEWHQEGPNLNLSFQFRNGFEMGSFELGSVL